MTPSPGALAVALALFAAILASPSTARALPIEVAAKPAELDVAAPEHRALGALVYRGGLSLTSPHPRFGGFSGLVVADDGSTLTALSDLGFWLTCRLGYAANGDLDRIDGCDLAPLRGLDGKAVPGKGRSDAEALTTLSTGGLAVAFEGRHRIWRYAAPGAPAEALPSPPGLEQAPWNGGIEAMAGLPSGRLLIVTEQLEVEGGVRGWLGRTPIVYPIDGGFSATDAAALPGGGALVLERRVLPPAIRLRAMPAAALTLPGALALRGPLAPREIARFDGRLTFDNMEGLAVRRGRDGETLVYLISDDNQNWFQRTLLMMFELRDERE